MDDYTCVTSMWRAYLKHKYGIDVPLVPEDGTLMMVMIKLAREAKHPKRDNLVDGCGYFKCTELIHEERVKRIGRAATAGRADSHDSRTSEPLVPTNQST